MADRQVSNLDETVAIGSNVEVDLALAAKGIVWLEPAERDYAAAHHLRGINRIENIG